MRLSFIIILSLLLPVLNACEDDKPYTPFAVATVVKPETAPEQSNTQKNSTDKQPKALTAEAAPSTREWDIFQRKLIAPEGLAFVSAVQLFKAIPAAERAQEEAKGATQGWKKSIYAWLAPSELSAFQVSEGKNLKETLNSPAAQSKKQPLTVDRSFRTKRSSFAITGLYLFDDSGRAIKKLAGLPEKQPLGGSCKLHTKLLTIGEQTLFLQHDSSCKKTLLPGQARRSLQILQPQRGLEATLLNWYLLQPLPGEKIQFGAQALDQDQDGNEDFTITVSLTSPSGVTEHADYSWVVRAAGASQQANLPYGRLQKRVERLDIASMRIKERVHASLELDALRRLIFSACKGSETEKVLDASGSPLQCGDTARLQAKITLASLRAAAGQRRFAQAIGYHEHAAWSTEKWSVKDAELAREIILKRVSHKPLASSEKLSPLKLSLPGAPHRSPFRFYAGSLLILEGDTYRVLKSHSPHATSESEKTGPFTSGTGGASAHAPNLPAAHQLLLKTQNGEFIQSALASCNRAEVQIAFVSDITKPPELKPLALLAPRPAQCHSFGLPPLPLSLVSFSGKHLNAIVSKELVSTNGKPVSLAEDVAYGTSIGLVVQGKGIFTLYESAEVSNATDCLVGQLVSPKSSENVVACLIDGEGILYHLEPNREESVPAKASGGAPL